jgi:hypothetical protein
VTEQLAIWADDEPLLRPMSRLADFLASAPAVLRPVPAPEPAIRVTTAFRGKLDFYLAALLATRRPPLPREAQSWCDRLRCWIFAQAVRQGLTGNLRDRHLKHVAAATRNAFDDPAQGATLTWLLALESEAISLAALSSDLERNAQVSDAAPPKLRSLASRLRAVARGEASPLPLPQGWTDGDWLGAIGFREAQATVTSLPLQPAPSPHALGDRVASITIPEDSSPAESAAISRSVPLAYAEDLNFLPYSWRHLHAEEMTGLRLVIEQLLAAGDESDRLLGAMAVVAWATGHSMATVGTIPIGTDLSDHWSLEPATLQLRRRPSRRSVRWCAGEQNRGWVVELADAWRLQLSPAPMAALRAALQRHADARYLGDLWRQTRTDSADVVFNDALRRNPLAGRITSGRLETVLRLQAFALTRDPVLARLLTARPNSGLPGAFAYPAWSAQTVAASFGAALPSTFISFVDTGAPHQNAAGSELDPIDELLAGALGGLKARYLAAAEDSERWIDRHNLLVSYCVVALLAATGARPVESPFESPAHLNWTRCLVFIEDKYAPGSGPAHLLGRVVPLPRAAVRLIAESYLGHLHALRCALAGVHPALAQEITKLANKQPSQTLPLFFYLVLEEGRLDWVPVRESTLGAMSRLDWPLPWNLMRHRLATRLRQLRLEPEIIHAVLGHGEHGVEPYGDHSLRVPAQDFAAACVAMESAYAGLRIEPLPIGPITISERAILPATGQLQPRLFGAALRRARRQQDHARARQAAQRELTDALGGRDPSTLSADEIEAIGRRMVLRPNGMPHPFGSLRYAVFERFIAHCWQQGKRVHRRRRDVVLREGALSHPPAAVDASDRLATVLRAYQDVAAAAEDLKGPGAALAAAVDVCLISRVSDRQLLTALWQRRDHRLVRFDGHFWLEYQRGLSDHPQQPVVRVPVSPLAARLLAISLGARRGGRAAKILPEPYAEVAKAAGVDPKAPAETLLSALATLVEAANSMELPRVLAAWLDGRVVSWGLLRHDWIRLRTGVARADPGLTQGAAPQAQESWAGPASSVGPARGPRRGSSQTSFDARLDAARRLIGACGRVLDQLASRSRKAAAAAAEATAVAERSPAMAESPEDLGETSVRRAARRRIERLARTAPPDTPSAVIALVEWIGHLLAPAEVRLAAASVRRYLDALAPRFRDFLHSVDLAELDADELTDVYAAMTEARYDVDADAQGDTTPDDEGDAGSADAGSSGRARHGQSRGRLDPALNRSYVAARLREFHAFARSRFGLEDPDWSEVADAGPCACGSPGAIREQEYLHALRSVAGAVATASRAQLCHGMLLLLTFRFGLRGREAHGLLRRDWVDHFETTVVLVRGNMLRGLKTPSAQRQVPQLCRFTDYERALVRRTLATWDAICDGDSAKPLLAMDAEGATLPLRDMRRTLIGALQAATRNPLTNLHHARHSFANELMLALAAPRGVLPQQQRDRWINATHARRLLLNDKSPTRRSLWALARTLGHASPLTSLRSYVHVLPDLLATTLALPQAPGIGAVPVADVDDLDRWPVDARYLQEPAPVTISEAQRRPTAAQCITALKLLRRGQSAEAIAHTLGVGVRSIVSIQNMLELTRQQLARGQRKRPAAGGEHHGVRGDPDLLVHIGKHRWDALAACIGDLDMVVVEEFDALAALRLIRPAAQLVLWRRQHFVWARAFVDSIGLRSGIAVFETDGLHPSVAAWADAAGFTRRRLQRNEAGVRVFQIDGVRDGEPEHPVLHRCALVPSEASPLRSRYELLVLWIAFCNVARPSDS